jgi:hypothetical protein
VFLKWLKMVFIPFLGFGGSFEAHTCFAGVVWLKPRDSCRPSTRPSLSYQTSLYWAQRAKAE